MRQKVGGTNLAATLQPITGKASLRQILTEIAGHRTSDQSFADDLEAAVAEGRSSKLADVPWPG